MKIQNSKKRILVLKKLYSLIKVSKLKSLSEIARFNKSFLKKFETALLSKDILNFFEKNYKFDNIFFSGIINKKNLNSTLWVYVTEEHEINSFSYDSLNKEVLKKINMKNDLFIAIGKDAIDFCKKNNINTTVTFLDNNSEGLVQKLSAILYSVYINENANEIKFILNTNKTPDKIVSILPIQKLDININNYEYKNTKDFEKYKLYPSISNINKNIIFIYLNSIISALITESKFYTIKQKYVKQNDLLKEIDKKINLLKREELNNKRKELTEEIILASQNQK